jgi:hypothetical protein
VQRKKFLIIALTAAMASGSIFPGAVGVSADSTSVTSSSSSSATVTDTSEQTSGSDSTSASSSTSSTENSSSDLTASSSTSTSSASSDSTSTDSAASSSDSTDSSSSGTNSDGGNADSSSDETVNDSSSSGTDNAESSSSSDTSESSSENAGDDTDESQDSEVNADDEEKAEEESEAAEEVENSADSSMNILSIDPNAGNISVDVQENEQLIYSYLTNDLKLNDAAAAGVMANMYYESNFNNAVISGDGTSYGLCQWRLGRYLRLVSYSQSLGLDYRTVDAQMKYLLYEFNTLYPELYAHLKAEPDTAEGAYDAGWYMCMYYEIPANREQQAATRGNAAKTIYFPKYYSNADTSNYDLNDITRQTSDYVQWMTDFADDDTHGYSEDAEGTDGDVGTYSFLYYALTENSYLEGEDEKAPFTKDNIAAILTRHGFAEQTDAEKDDSLIQSGDIVISADSTEVAVAKGDGIFVYAKASSISGSDAEGDQNGDEVTAGNIVFDAGYHVYRLVTKDTQLPSYASWMVKYAYDDRHGSNNSNDVRVMTWDVDQMSYLFRALYENDVFDDSINYADVFDRDMSVTGLARYGFRRILPPHGHEDNRNVLQPGDVVYNDSVGMAVYLGNDMYAYATKADLKGASTEKGDQTGTEVCVHNWPNAEWDVVMRLNSDSND